MINDTPEVVVQDVRNFTVQVLYQESDNTEPIIVGTGILIDKDGRHNPAILTCLHVIMAAGHNPKDRENTSNNIMLIRFAARDLVKHGFLKVKVSSFFLDYDDDIVILTFIDSIPLISKDKYAVLGTAEQSFGNPFRSYGYAPLGEKVARYIDGKIMGDVEIINEQKLQADPIELKTFDVRAGISGAGVLDLNRNLVVGIISSRWNPGQIIASEDGNADNIAWALDNKIVTFPPMNIMVRQQALPKGLAPTPNVSTKELELASPSSLTVFKDAPEPVEDSIGNTIHEKLNMDWMNPSSLVSTLVSFSTNETAKRVRAWVNKRINSQIDLDGVFWWNFKSNRDINSYFSTILDFLGAAHLGHLFSNIEAKVNFAAGLIRARKYILIFDGLEYMLSTSGDIKDQNLADFLGLIAAPGHKSFSIIINTLPVLDLVRYTTSVYQEVDAFGALFVLSKRATQMYLSIEDSLKPSNVSLDYHLKYAENASYFIVSNKSSDSHINVKMSWNKNRKRKNTTHGRRTK